MSRPHSDVAISFVSHLFSSGCNLSSMLQHISSCSALLQVATLLSGRDIISNPQCEWSQVQFLANASIWLHVATSFQNLFLVALLICLFFYVATSFFGKDLSCGFIDGSLSRPHSGVVTSFIFFWRRDIEMMSRHEFLHLIVSFSLDHVFFVATFFFKSRLDLFKFSVSSSKPNLLMS